MAEHENLDTLFHAQITGALHHDGVVTGVIAETISGRREFLADIVIDCTGDAVIASSAGAPIMGEEDELRHARQPVTLSFRLSNVDVMRFRAMPRDQKRALAMKGLASGELFWESMSFCSTPNGHDAICLMSRITGVDALDDRDVSAAERTGRKQIRSNVGFLNREVPGFEKAILSSIASRIGVRERTSAKIHAEQQHTSNAVSTTRIPADAFPTTCMTPTARASSSTCRQRRSTFRRAAFYPGMFAGLSSRDAPSARHAKPTAVRGTWRPRWRSASGGHDGGLGHRKANRATRTRPRRCACAFARRWRRARHRRLRAPLRFCLIGRKHALRICYMPAIRR